MKSCAKDRGVGIIGGNYLLNLDILKGIKPKNVYTSYGKVFCYQIKNSFLIPRHGLKNLPPHRINHKANISIFKKFGVKYIVSFNSVGSLKKEIKPGQVLLVSDYIDFNPPTFYEKRANHITPEISPKLREFLIATLKKIDINLVRNGASNGAGFLEKGIYFQTKGPRLETKAEINLIKNFADVVGMTMASEATLAKELDLEYAALCFIDNYANGIIEKPLTQKEIEENQVKSVEKIEKIIQDLLQLSKKPSVF